MSQNIQKWVIGDLQGCITPVYQLIEEIKKESNDPFELYFVGDLCNRGPESLETLEFLMNPPCPTYCILGNHDLHLLAVYAGIRKQSKGDTLSDILQHPNSKDIIDWVRQQPLARYIDGHLMVHAGVLAQWTTKKTLKLAEEVSTLLKSDQWTEHLKYMYGNEPNQWSKNLEGHERTRVIINTLTRIRFCKEDGSMDFSCKLPPEQAPKDLMPWFDVPHRKTADTPIIFGHWSALGFINKPHIISLDSGYVWGRELTAIRLSDRKIIQIASTLPRQF